MKKMMTSIKTLAALLIASATVFTACSNDDDSIINEQQPAQGAKTYTMTINASKGGDATTRALSLEGKTLNVKWNAGEAVEVMMTDNAYTGTYTSIGTLTAAASETGATTLTGTVSGLTAGKTLRFFLRSHLMDYTNQKGVLLKPATGTDNSIESNYDYAASGDVTNYTIDGSNITVTGGVALESQQAIVKFNLKDESGNDINATSLEIKENTGTSGHIYQKRDYNVLSGGDNSLGPLTITPASATSTVYAAIYDYGNTTGSTSSYTLTATTSDGRSFRYTKDNILFNTGKYYEIAVKMNVAAPTYTLLSAATTSDYGKVVCAAGHLHDAKTAVPAGCTAVGIVGKVTETGHGLILALQDATSQTWNTINGWTSVTTYAGTTLKVLPDDAARGTNLTSYTALGETAVSNWAVAQKSDYEAIFTNLGSTAGDSDGWTYDSKVNGYITTGVGGTALSGDAWSATESTSNSVWYFGSVCWGSDSKTLSYSVRPVLGF